MHSNSDTSAKPALPLVVAAFTGFGFAFFRFGLHVLDPTNIGWLHGDSTWHFLV